MSSRADHVRWCKKRALAYLPDNPREAITSMMSDLRKHEDTVEMINSMGMIVMFELMDPTPESARRFIEGFAE